MREIYSSGYAPDPKSARDILAFVLCPSEVFVSEEEAEEAETVAEIVGPVKEEAVRRWQERRRAGDVS